MKILVTGAAGMLGTAMVPSLATRGHQLVTTDIDTSDTRPWGEAGPVIQSLDVRSARDVDEGVESSQPDHVIHLAAETDLETCETDPDNAHLTNAEGTRLVALACKRAGIPMTYVSTAGVFDGKKTDPYTELDAPNPINVYGKTKREGEGIVAELLERSFIVRAGWMVGGGPRKDHKFVSRIIDQIEHGSRIIRAVGDKLGTPTYTDDFARCYADLLESHRYGLYHMCCEGSATRHDVARLVLEVLNRPEIALVEVESAYFKSEFFAPRPRSELMRNMALDLQGMNTMRPWEDAIAEYLHLEFDHLVNGDRKGEASHLEKPQDPPTA